MCHTLIKPDLLGFPRINVFLCGLLGYVFKRFVSERVVMERDLRNYKVL
jgi:hypothetical protein